MTRLPILSKYAGVAVLTIVLIIGPTSCLFWENCPDAEPYFSVRGLKVLNNTQIGNSTTAWRPIEENEIVNSDQYVISVYYDKNFHSRCSSGGQALYALSCEENGYAGSLTGIDTLYLVSLGNYRGWTIQNDTLNEIVVVDDGITDTSKPNLGRFIAENRERISQMSFNVRLNEPPLEDGEYEFKLILELTDGQSFTATSERVRMQK